MFLGLFGLNKNVLLKLLLLIVFKFIFYVAIRQFRIVCVAHILFLLDHTAKLCYCFNQKPLPTVSPPHVPAYP